MEYAEESKETTYFDEEAAAAKEAVEGVSLLSMQGRLTKHLTCDSRSMSRGAPFA